MVAKWTGDATGVHPIYHALMAKKKLPYMSTTPHTKVPLEVFAAGQIASTDVKTLGLKTTVPEVASLLASHKHHAFPTVGLDGSFLGLVRREHLVGIIKSPALWTNTEVLPVPPKLAGKFSAQQVSAFSELFTYYDADGSGDIDRDELGNILKSLGEDVTESKLDALMREVDEDGDGDVSWEVKEE